MKNRQKTARILLVLTLCMSIVTGCAAEQKVSQEIAPMEAEESHAVSLSYIGGSDVMPIAAYLGPTHPSRFIDGYGAPKMVSDEIFSMIGDMGINLLSYSPMDYAESPGIWKDYLDYAHKYGIGVLVTDSNVLSKADGGEVTKEEVLAEIQNYCNHPAFCGMYLVDEPDAPYYKLGSGEHMISEYGNLAKVLQQDLDLLCYSNLLPVQEIEKVGDSYIKYVEEFLETFKPKVLMWDNYAISIYGRENHLWNMNLMREYAMKYDIPFWPFVQAGGQWFEDEDIGDGEKYFPNEGEFNWDVNTCLAFGAQGIQYFSAIQPEHFAYINTPEGEFERNGLIGIAGNKNKWYYYAQNIHKHIGAIDEVLMNSVSKGLVVSGEQAAKEMEGLSVVIEGGQFRELKAVQGDAVVGCFNYGGKTALYVVNYSTKYAQNITVEFNDTHKIRMIQNAENSHLRADSLTLDMAAGEGILLVIE